MCERQRSDSHTDTHVKLTRTIESLTNGLLRIVRVSVSVIHVSTFQHTPEFL